MWSNCSLVANDIALRSSTHYWPLLLVEKQKKSAKERELFDAGRDEPSLPLYMSSSQQLLIAHPFECAHSQKCRPHIGAFVGGCLTELPARDLHLSHAPLRHHKMLLLVLCFDLWQHKASAKFATDECEMMKPFQNCVISGVVRSSWHRLCAGKRSWRGLHPRGKDCEFSAEKSDAIEFEAQEVGGNEAHAPPGPCATLWV